VLRAIGRDLLERYGRDYRVVHTKAATEALELLRQEREATRPVALLLSDQRMPGVDGTMRWSANSSAAAGMHTTPNNEENWPTADVTPARIAKLNFCDTKEGSDFRPCSLNIEPSGCRRPASESG